MHGNLDLSAACMKGYGMIITVVGAGGKTTICLCLGKELSRRGGRVLFTTTTQIYRPDCCPVFVGDPEDLSPSGRFTAAGSQEIQNGKLKGFTAEETDAIERRRSFDYILVEGDGAKGRPVKAPAEWEPVYPGLTRLAVGVIGLDCLGKPVSEENVHRSELFMQITGAHPGEVIKKEHLQKLIVHPLGLFRHAPQAAEKVVLCNKTDRIGNNTDIEEYRRKSGYPVFAAGRDRDWADEFIGKFILPARG